MDQTRLSLQHRLEKFRGIKKVYYSPPSGLRMEYPCIRYNLVNNANDFADNAVYIGRRRYSLTLIDPDPDSSIVEEVLKLPYCALDRTYTAENLQHFVFTLYY